MKYDSVRHFFASINCKSMAMNLLIGFIAVFTGLVAVTANPVMIALVVGMIAGIALLMAPRVSVWLLLVLGLTSGFFVSMVPSLRMLPWALTLLSMLLLLPVSLKFIENKSTPAFIVVGLSFMIFALLATFVQWHSIAQLVAGFKRYFQMYGLMFALALLVFRPEDYRSWLRLMLIIALAQLPFALFEHFVLIRMRIGHGINAADASDVVAGTLGANLEGGSVSAEMAAFLIMAMAFLLARWKQGLLQKSKVVWMCLLCLLPLGLGETKIVIVLLPLVWLIVMREDIRRSTGRFVVQALSLAIVVTILGVIYLGFNEGSSADVLRQTIKYNIGNQGYGANILNRSTVFSFWWSNQSWNDPLGLLLGHGLGSSYFSPNNPIPGNIAVKYHRYGIDLTAASSLLWDTGLLGFTLFLAIFVTAFVSAGSLHKQAVSPVVRADALAIQACVAVFFVFIFYDNTLVNYLPFEVIAAAILGYLGYLLSRSNMERILA